MSVDPINDPMTSEIEEQQAAEADALGAEALRFANQAKMASARLAEVKKTLALFSSKLEKAEQGVLTAEENEEMDVDPTPFVVTQSVIEDCNVVEEVETPTSVGSRSSVDTPDSYEGPKLTASEINAIRNYVGVPYKKGVVEGFFDGIGLDKACGVDDETLGLVPKPVPTHFEAAHTEEEEI